LEDPGSEPYLWLIQIYGGFFSGEFTTGILISLVIILILLFCSAMISGAEIAFFSLNPLQLKEIESKETKPGNMILSQLKNPKLLLATILITKNFLNVGIVILSAYVLARLFDFSAYPITAILLEIIAIAFMILLFVEIIPKIYSSQKPVACASFMARPLNLLIRVLHPVSYVLVKTTSLIDRKLAAQNQTISMTDLSDAIEISVQKLDSQKDDTKILKGIVKFTDIEVSEIMRSRMDVIAIDATSNFEEVINIVKESGYSRIPVYTDTFDKIEGILYVKDLLPHLDKPRDFGWQKLIRPAFFVPENKKINDLLQEIRQKKIHLAIVVDEYGGTSGIVTLEDVLEEIVGEISDEFDSPEDEIEYNKIDDHHYIFEGKTSINDFCKIIGVDDHVFDDVKGEADSIAGMMLELHGKMPEKNTVVSYLDYDFKVLTVDKRRIKMVNVTINEKKERNVS
jgi:gliding motility-associated protein GldE